MSKPRFKYYSSQLRSFTLSSCRRGLLLTALVLSHTGFANAAGAVSGSDNSANEAKTNLAPEHQWGQDADHSRVGLEVGFVQNGPRTGVELELDSKRAHGGWGPLIGIGMRTIDVEGHFFSDDPGATEVHSAAFVFLALKMQNPTQSGLIYPYGVIKLGALLQGDLANAKAVGAGYVGLGAEFPYNELVKPLFSRSLIERSLSFFIETGIAGSQSRATKITGHPFVFNGIASTIGIKWYL